MGRVREPEVDIVPWLEDEPFLAVPGERYRLVGQQSTANGRGPHWIARGGQGAVYAALSQRRSTQYAIKFPLAEHWSSTEHLNAFLEEAELGKEVRGSNYLGSTIDLIDLRNCPRWPPWCLVMEYFPATLAQVRKLCKDRDYRFPRSQVIKWAEQLASGLTHLHDRLELVHRDVTDRNIMFRLSRDRLFAGHPEALLDAEAVLTDFGTVCAVGQTCRWLVLRRDGDVWKDPALYTSNGQVGTPAMDVYAFGAVLRILDELGR
jgi:serine/threonine protein kinase